MSENVILAEGVEAPLQVSESAERVGGGTPPLPVKVAAAAQWVALDQIEVRREMQVRAGMMQESYLEAMLATLQANDQLPAVVVYEVGGLFILADGFHRYEAHRRAGKAEISAYVRKGTLEEALGAAEEANLENSQALTPADKYNIYKRRWLRNYQLPDGLAWAAVSGRTRAKLLKVSPDTESRWARIIAEELQITRAVKVMGSDGRIISTEKNKQTAQQKAARERLALKVKLATRNGKLTERDHNYLIEEVSDDPRDLRLYITRPGQGRVEINGRYEIPSKVYADQQQAIKRAEQAVSDNPPSERVEPNHVIVLKDGEWQPETLKAVGRLEHVTVGEAQASPINVASIETYTTTNYRYSRLDKAIGVFEDVIAELEEALQEAKQTKSIRSINEAGAIWRDGTRGLLAAALESIERVYDHREAVLQLLEQLEGQDG